MSCSKLLEGRDELEKLAIFHEASPFVVTDTKKKLALVPGTVEELSRIGLPLSIVTIAGLYRTGKSYLMNRLAKVQKGFPIGHSPNAMTKGIWIRCLMHPERPGEVLMLMDTEGLGDIMKGDAHHDNSLFTLAVLLSSTMVYNCKNAFDNNALDNITYPFSD